MPRADLDAGHPTAAAAGSLLGVFAHRLTLIWLSCAAIAVLVQPPEGDRAVSWPVVAGCVVGAGATVLATQVQRLRRASAVLGAGLATATCIAVEFVSHLQGPWLVTWMLVGLLGVVAAITWGPPGAVMGAAAAAVAAVVTAQDRDRAAVWTPDLVIALQALQVIAIMSVAVACILAVRRSAARLDDALRRADEAHVARAADRAARDRAARIRRTLHDSALNTLEAVSHHGALLPAAFVRERCAADVELLQGALSGIVEAMPIQERLEALRRTATPAHLDIDIAVRGEPPPSVTEAFASAAAEAVRNAIQHGGATTIQVAGAASPTQCWLEISDDGSGAPASETRPRFGVAESIVGRLSDIGGDARIETDRAEGVRVRLDWDAAGTPALESLDPTRLDQVPATALGIGVVTTVVASVLSVAVARSAWERPALVVIAVGILTAGFVRTWRVSLRRPVEWADALVAAAAVLLAAALAVGADPLCVAVNLDPVGLMSALLLAALVLLRPTASVTCLALVTAVATSALEQALWHAIGATCIPATPTWLLAVAAIVSAALLSAELHRQDRQIDAVRTANASDQARLVAARLHEADRTAWIRPVMRAVERELVALASGAADASDPATRGRCGGLAGALRALLTLGPHPWPLQQLLRRTTMQAHEQHTQMLFLGDIAAIEPPAEVTKEAAHFIETALSAHVPDLTVVGWRGPDRHGLTLRATAPTQPEARADLDGWTNAIVDGQDVIVLREWTVHPDPPSDTLRRIGG